MHRETGDSDLSVADPFSPAGRLEPLVRRILSDRRIRIVTGHYGSGKTEFAVNYALILSRFSRKTALVDLDIVNPYFRSRERRSLLEKAGIRVISNSFGIDTNVDVPALSADIEAPLQDEAWNVVLDVGGDAAGARVLGRYSRHFVANRYDMFCVFNASRPETRTADDAVAHVKAIEAASKTRATGIVNNTHLLYETTAETVSAGQYIAEETARRLGIGVSYVSALERLENELAPAFGASLIPLALHMREDWMRM